MLERMKGESEQEFIARAMADATMLNAHPEEQERRAVATAAWKHLENATGDDGWPKSFLFKFIQPGLVRYEEHGLILVQKPTLDRMLPTLVGKPVVYQHQDVSPRVYTAGDAGGIITRAWYNADDGWYWCEALVWDEDLKEKCENTQIYSVSCAYDVLDRLQDGGQQNMVPYDQEVLNGAYTHMAVVPNPRYEGARILVQNSGGDDMKIFGIFGAKKEKKDLKNSVLSIDGSKVPLTEALAIYNAAEAAKALENAEPLDENMMVEVDGTEVPLKNVINAYRTKLKNEADEKEKADKDEKERKNAAEDEEKKKKEKEEMEAKNAAEKEAKEKADLEAKNAADKEKADKEAKEKADKEALENSAGAKSFEELQKLANNRKGDGPAPEAPKSRRELAELGKKQYGEK